MDQPEFRVYAERCFSSCDSAREREAMDRKLRAIISRALTAGRMREMGALPYSGNVQAAAKAQDREAIRTIMAWRTAKERGEAPPAAAPAPPAPIDWDSYPTPPLDRREIAREGLKDACLGRAFMENEDAVDLTRRALDLGVPIDDALDRENLSPLALAAKCRVVEVANYLLDRGAKATSQALIWACASHGPATHEFATNESPLELVERLLKAGADVREGGSIYGDDDKFTPLYYAVKKVSAPLVRLLLDHGAPVDLGRVDASPAGYEGLQTPLCWACKFGEVRMARLLLARGARWDKITHSDPKCAEWATPLLAVRLRMGRTTPLEIQMNRLFDDFLAHYWALRVALRLFGRRENHASGPQRLVLGDAYLPNKIGAFIVGDGILVKNPSRRAPPQPELTIAVSPL